MTNPQTQSGPLSLQALAQLSHDIRDQVDVIMELSEVLLTAAGGSTPVIPSAQVDAVLQAGRRALWVLNASLPESLLETSHAHLEKLFNAMRGPHETIIAAADACLAAAEAGGHAQVAADIRRLRDAASRLLTVPSPPTPQPGAPAAVAGEIDPAAQRILVADGSEETRNVLAQRLTRQGFGVTTAADGATALRHLATQPVHLVLLGVSLPDMEGLDVLEQIKAGAKTRSTPVIIVSAQGDQVVPVARCLALGAEDHLRPPFDAVFLRARVMGCLERKRLRDREAHYLRKLDGVIRAAGELEAGRYRAGSLAQLVPPGDLLEPLAKAFDGVAGHAADRTVQDKRKQAQWQKASVFIDAGAVDALKNEIAAARKPRPTDEDKQ